MIIIHTKYWSDSISESDAISQSGSRGLLKGISTPDSGLGDQNRFSSISHGTVLKILFKPRKDILLSPLAESRSGGEGIEDYRIYDSLTRRSLAKTELPTGMILPECLLNNQGGMLIPVR